MTQTPYLAEITESGCAAPPPGLDAALTVWPADAPRCTLAELLGVSERALLEFMFNNDFPPIASPPPDPAAVPTPAAGLVLLTALGALALFKRRT